MRHHWYTIRNINVKVSQIDVNLLYNGSCEEYEDIADYWRGGRIVKRAVKIG